MKQNNEKLTASKYAIPVIGITGGVGSGKSIIMDILKAHYHAGIILADDVGHDLMEPGLSNYLAIVDEFGTGILDSEGYIDRTALASIVFSDEEKLRILNEITHPNIKSEIIKRVYSMIDSGKYRLVAVEAALLIEGNYGPLFDEMWYISVEKEIRIERLAIGRGYSREKSLSIIDSQLKDEVYDQECDRVIDNNGSVNDIVCQLDQILGESL